MKGPILCFVGPPGVGKTSLAQVDRHVARPQVRARLARRHARRGRDPRPPPHLHRRAARPDHPGPAPRRVEEPGLHPRRDRQARLRLPRRSGVRAARGARPGAEQHVPRSLPRRAVRPVRGALHHHRQRARPDSAGRCATAWRCSSSPGYTEEEKLEIAREHLVVEAGAEPRPDAGAASRSTRRALRAVIRGYTREAGVRNLEREIGALCRKVARRRAEGERGTRSPSRPRSWWSCSAPRASSTRRWRSAPRTRAWPSAWPGRRSAARCCSSRPRGCRRRQRSRSPASSAT